MRHWKPERLILGLMAALIIFTAGYFAGRATATPDGSAAILVEHPPVVEETQEETPSEAAGAPESAAAEVVDVNTADLETLMTLPGIGETLAQRIIDYREANGPFATAEDLMEVSGIGEKRLDAIRDFISVGE